MTRGRKRKGKNEKLDQIWFHLQDPTTTKRKKPSMMGPTVYLDSFLEPADTMPRLLMLLWCLSLRRRIFAGAGCERKRGACGFGVLDGWLLVH
jgi:hypothetical protein